MSQSLAANSVISHYRIVSKIGEGGMGEVWLAEDTRLGRKVALKLLPAEITEDSERVRRFTQEAKAASALNHPNIISVYDIGECESGRYIVMEFVAGQTLRSVIAKDNSLETLFTLGVQMARALQAAHAAGITHRDIKPDNIMVRDDGYVKMLDFGLARLLPTTASDPEAMTLAQQTTPGTVMGTLAYMSPEQASGQTAGPASDVFALGIVLYELATAHHPFKSETMIGYLHAITSQVPPSMSSLKSNLPPALDDLILRMLEKDAKNRPAASEVAQALQEIEKSGTSNTLPVRVIADKPKATPTDEGFWVAVLPFKYRGANADIEALAEGLSEDILTGLSRFSYLRVIARSSTLRFTSDSVDVRDAGKQLGARYVMEGSLRQAGSLLRVSVQLVDASTGAHLWAETYDRPFSAEEIFALQDDLVPRIVSTVADINGVLPRSMSEAVCSRSPDELSPYEAVLRSFRYYGRVTAEELKSARSCLELAVERAPTYGDAWAMLALLCVQDYAQGFNLQSDSLKQGTTAAQRAVEAAPSNHLAYFSLAQAQFFQKELQSFRNAAERAVVLNPMDGNSLAFIGELLTYVGDSERGLALASRARQFNPNHPGWFWYADFFHAYRHGDYRDALSLILKANMPGHWGMHAGIAACASQLGEHETATKAIRDLLKLQPDFGATVRNTLAKWFDPELCEQLLDGLRKAGLKIADGKTRAHQVSSEKRADEGFWIAVLPFKFTGTDTELAALAEGLSGEIVTGLSRFSYLRVIARGSTLRYANHTVDLRTVGKELGARYLMEGNLRQAGTKLRLAIQLVDTISGAHLWAENYERTFSPEVLFELQDDLVPRIVSTVADWYGVLPHSMSEAIRSKDSDQLSPYEAVLRGVGYYERVTAEEHAVARAGLERAVQQAPGNADCWAMLSFMFGEEHRFGFNLQPDPLGRALQAARQAADIAPSNHFAHLALAQALFFRKEFDAFRIAAMRAIDLNPMDGSAVEYMAHLIAFAGDWELGCELAERARLLNPNHPGWYWAVPFYKAYRSGDYQTARNFMLKMDMPNVFFWHIMRTAVYGQLGDQEVAAEALRDLLRLKPDFARTGRNELEKWYAPELVDHLMDGLHKAGLEVAATEGSTERPDNPSVPDFTGRPAIAVLPFDNLSRDPEQEYFADGLAEDLITRLSLWRSFPVIARNSSFAYKGKAIDVKKVSADLGVRYVVEGSVRKAGNNVRISAQLIDATMGHHVWAKTYDRELNNVFAVQDEISGAIAASLVGDLERAEHARVQRRDPDSLEAWGLYQRALPLIYNFTREDCAQARTLLESAVTHDPHFSTALARLAEVGIWEVLYEWTADSEKTLNTAIAQARRAVTLDPLDAQARVDLSFALMTAGDGRGALEESRQAVELNPSMPFALAIHAYHCHIAGYSPAESIAFVQRALRLSPHDPVEWLFYDVLSGAYLNAGRFAEGLEAGRRLIALSPNYYWGYLWSAMNAVSLGQIEEARQLIREARRVKLELSFDLARKCLGTMAPDVERRFCEALRQAGLEERTQTAS